MTTPCQHPEHLLLSIHRVVNRPGVYRATCGACGTMVYLSAIGPIVEDADALPQPSGVS